MPLCRTGAKINNTDVVFNLLIFCYFLLRIIPVQCKIIQFKFLEPILNGLQYFLKTVKKGNCINQKALSYIKNIIKYIKISHFKFQNHLENIDFTTKKIA